MSFTEDDNPLQTKSTAKLHKKSICHECNDRRLVGEYFEDIKKEDLGIHAAGRGLKTCKADIVVELHKYGLTYVRKAGKKEYMRLTVLL